MIPSTIDHNEIYNNTYGIMAAECECLLFSDNTIRNNNLTGLWILAYTFGKSSTNEIDYNDISNNKDGLFLLNTYFDYFGNNLFKFIGELSLFRCRCGH
jgi:nitrous oxidase accessory protein NosD